MANPNKTTETEQYILNRVKHADIDALDVIPYTLSTDGLTATPVSTSAPIPIKVIDSDGTDNSLSTGGQIGQKQMIVGTIDLPVRGIAAEAASLSQIQPVFVGANASGVSAGLTAKILDSRNGIDIQHSSIGSRNLIDFHSDSTQLLANQAKIFSPGGTRATYFDTIGYGNLLISFIDNTGGGTPGTLYARWSRDGSNTAYNDPDDGTGLSNYYAIYSQSENNNPSGGYLVPLAARYVNFVYKQSGNDQGTTYPQLCEFQVTLVPIGFSSSVKVVNPYLTVAGITDTATAETAPVIMGGLDAVSSSTTAYPLVLDSSGRPSVNQMVGSTVANNGTDSGNPHKIGGVANSSVPTAVTTARRVAAWFDLNGRQQVSLGDPGVSLLASASRTTTQTSADLTNATGKGIVVTLDMTVVTAGPDVTLSIKYKDPASGKYIALLTGAAVTTVSTNVYRIYPGLTAAANATVSDVLPRTFQIVVTANNANAGTYSVGYNIIP